jgi:hypothetical protein
MTNVTSAKITIFEGPDGGGKTTAATEFAKETGARYVHFSALPRVDKGLGRMYVEAMLPALLGYQDVVLDRCWLSEEPYGVAFRNNRLRITEGQIRVLERLALRCGAVVVRCLPSWEVVRNNYLSRKNLEMLDNEDQLRVVYDFYKRPHQTHLPSILFDYTSSGKINKDMLDAFRAPRHPLHLASAGDWRAKLVLVGDRFGEQKDEDAFYQWPFGSLSNTGCSQWLTQQLINAGIREDQLLWINSDQDLWFLKDFHFSRPVFALGGRAHKELLGLNLTNLRQVPHPQFWKRFQGALEDNYPLIQMLIKEKK